MKCTPDLTVARKPAGARPEHLRPHDCRCTASSSLGMTLPRMVTRPSVGTLLRSCSSAGWRTSGPMGKGHVATKVPCGAVPLSQAGRHLALNTGFD